MGQLKVRDLLAVLDDIKKRYCLSPKELKNLNIYLGDDEELNGIHYGLFCQEVNIEDSKGYTLNDVAQGKITITDYSAQSLATDIKELNEKQKGLCILIS